MKEEVSMQNGLALENMSHVDKPFSPTVSN